MLLAMEWAMFPDDVRHPERKRAIRLARLSRRYRLYREPSGTLALMKIVATGGRTAGTRYVRAVGGYPVHRPILTSRVIQLLNRSVRRGSAGVAHPYLNPVQGQWHRPALADLQAR